MKLTPLRAALRDPEDGSRGDLPAPTLSERLLDDGSDWFNLACSRIAVVMVAGVLVMWILTEVLR